MNHHLQDLHGLRDLPDLAGALRLPACAALIGLALAAGLTPSHAASYSFAQAGFAGGGSLSGTFSGTDGNANGLLSLDELSSFAMSFGGDSLVGNLSLTLADLDGFVFDLGAGPLLGDGALEGISTTSGSFLAGQAVIGSVASYVIEGNNFSDAGGAISVRLQPTDPQPLSAPALGFGVALVVLAVSQRARLRRATSTADPCPAPGSCA